MLSERTAKKARRSGEPLYTKKSSLLFLHYQIMQNQGNREKDGAVKTRGEKRIGAGCASVCANRFLPPGDELTREIPPSENRSGREYRQLIQH